MFFFFSSFLNYAITEAQLTSRIGSALDSGGSIFEIFNRKGLVGELVIGGYLVHSDHEVVKFKILGDRRKTTTKSSTLDIGRAGLWLLREVVIMVPWEFAFEGAGIYQHRSLLKYYIIRVQEKRTPKCQKSSR